MLLRLLLQTNVAGGGSGGGGGGQFIDVIATATAAELPINVVVS